MKKSTKKVVIIICCVLAVALIAGGTVVGVNVYNKNVKEQHIEQILSDIKGKYYTFVNESDRDKRIIIIKNLENDLTDYLKNNEPVEKIKEEYQSDLEQMKSYFVTYYEKVISDNTLNEVEKITDKTKLKACKDKLTTLLDKLNSEKDAVLSSEKFEELKTKIQDLIDKYSARIDAIEQAEKEAKDKLEQEAQTIIDEGKEEIEEVIEPENNSYTEESNTAAESTDTDSNYDSSDDDSDTPNDLVPITPFELRDDYIYTY